MRRPLALLLLAAGLILIIAGLRALPRPLAPASQQCQGSAAPALCRALVRAGGAPAAPPDLGPADLAELQDLAPAPDLSPGPGADDDAADEEGPLALALGVRHAE